MPVEGCLVDVNGVRKSYGPKHALAGVDLRVRQGEVVGLVGPNGAGKSTLMKVLTGMATCSAGEGQVLGTPLSDLRRNIPFVGVMIERPSFIEGLDGRSNLRLLAGIRGGADESRIEEVLERVGLSRAGGVRVRRYSLGMRQRLSLAQAIMERPRLLVLDEPTNGLDPDGILDMRREVKEQARIEGAGVLVSSHLLSEVEAACDRVVLLEGGRVRGEFRPGPPDEGDIRLELSDPGQVDLVRCADGVESITAAEGRSWRVRARVPVPELVRALVQDGVRIEAVYRASDRLEEVYREVVGRAG